MSLALNTPADVLRKLRKTSAGDLFFFSRGVYALLTPASSKCVKNQIRQILTFQSNQEYVKPTEKRRLFGRPKNKNARNGERNAGKYWVDNFLTCACVVVVFSRARV